MSDELAPHWQQRAAGSLGVVDMAATRRRYDRTTGWALQRLARANEVLARYAGSNGRGMSDALLFARLPVVAAAVVEPGTDAGSLSLASSPAEVAATAAGSTPAVSPAPAMLARLQRRVDQPGVLSAQSLARTRSETGALMRSALAERLTARGAAVPGASAPALPLARRLDSAPQDHDVGGHDDAATSPVVVSAPSIPMQDTAPVEHTVQRTPAVSMQGNTTGAGAAGHTSTDVGGADATPFVPLIKVTPVASASDGSLPGPLALSPSKDSANQGKEPFDRLRANGREVSGRTGSSPSTTATLSLSRTPIAEISAASPAQTTLSSITARAIPVASDLTSLPPLLARRASSTAAAYPSHISDAPLPVGARPSVATGANHVTDSPAGQNAASQGKATILTTTVAGGPQTTSMLPMARIARQSDGPAVSAATHGDQSLTLHAPPSAVESTSLPAVSSPALSLAPPITPLASSNIARGSDALRIRADTSAAPSLILRAAHSDATESSASIVRETARTQSYESTPPPASVLQRSSAAAIPVDSPALTLHAPLMFVAEHSSTTPAVTAANPGVAVSPAVLARAASSTTATLPRAREIVSADSTAGAERALSLSSAPNAVSSNDTNVVQSGLASRALMGVEATRGSMPAASSALIWRSPQAATPASESTSARGGEQQASVMRAMAATLGAASPASATETASTAVTSTPLVSAPAPSLPDVHGLAEQVMRLITRRLEVERDRRGGKRWR